MDHGARSYSTNSIGKTASELAAFVGKLKKIRKLVFKSKILGQKFQFRPKWKILGQHECVSIINNHISIDEVESYLHPKGENSEEKFPQELADFIHAMCSSNVVSGARHVLKRRYHKIASSLKIYDVIIEK